MGVPVWMATFSDMAILLMAFFVLLLSMVQFDIQSFQKLSGSMRLAFGVETINLNIKPPSARSLIVDTFSPADSQSDLSDAMRQKAEESDGVILLRNTKQFDDKYDVEREFEILQAVLANEIERGEVEVKIEDDSLIVEVNTAASAAGTNQGALERRAGVVPQIIIQVSETVAQVQSELIREVNVFAVSNSAADDSEERERIAEERFEQVRSSLQSQEQNGRLVVERIDDEIIIRIASQDSFQSGGANLTSQFQLLLADVARSIEAVARRVRVEGHSDNQPIAFSDEFRSNWDLSAARASNVTTELLQRPTLENARFSIVGFADTVPVASNETAEGRALNRRIEIKLSDFIVEQ
jgi:chemotaxis protein MotB